MTFLLTFYLLIEKANKSLVSHRYVRNKWEKDTRRKGSCKLFRYHQGSRLSGSGVSPVRFSPPSHPAPHCEQWLSDSQGQSPGKGSDNWDNQTQVVKEAGGSSRGKGSLCDRHSHCTSPAREAAAEMRGQETKWRSGLQRRGGHSIWSQESWVLALALPVPWPCQAANLGLISSSVKSKGWTR